MRLLAVDAGNSRIKWGLHAAGTWREQGWTPTVQPLLSSQWAALPRPNSVTVSNVAGTEARDAITEACLPWQIQPHFIRALPDQCGISNGYAEPERLGPDRWAALIAARHRHPDRPLLLVQAGTAVTIDSLDADGHFPGGVILPGVKLMLDALAGNTAELNHQPGKLADFPDNTADAMFSGALNAIAGAVERRYRQHATPPLCLLGGGDADILLPLLSFPAQRADNLVLEGLFEISRKS